MNIITILSLLRPYILFAIIIALGIIASYTDVKKRRIENRFVIPAFIIGLLINLTYWGMDFLGHYLFGVLFALFVTFVLWYVGFWNAGDGKLFLAFTSLIPAALLYGGVAQLHSYWIIFYTFVPVFFVLLVLLIIHTRWKDIKYVLKEFIKPQAIFLVMLAFFAFQWIIHIFNDATGITLNFFISVLILFFFFEAMEKILPFRIMSIFVIVAISRFIIDFRTIFTFDFVIVFFLQFSVFIIMVYFILHLAYVKYGKHAKIQDLKPGMLLSEIIYKKGKVYATRPNVQISLFMFLRTKVKEKPLIEITSNGLTREDIELLKRLHREKKLEVGSLLVQMRIPFAPFLFLGVVLYILTELLHVF